MKEYIANLLNSIKKAQHEFKLEIFVVDNASGDNSISYLEERFPEVQYIANQENIGFGRANNQALKQAKGEYTLIINPDTLVSEDTLEVLIRHMEENPKCGAAGCKILNPNGGFARECRRSVPDLRSAIFRMFSLDTLFPKSRLFGKRYLGWLSESEPAEVPVISGSCMFWRTSLLKKLGGFDEDFFMYGEDDDLCYRVQDTDYHIDYVPETSIIHYKGESARKGDLKHIRIFNKGLYQFFEKHYSYKYSLFSKMVIYLATWLKTIVNFFSSNINKVKSVFVDLFILNLSIAVGFVVRYAFLGDNIINPEGIKYLWINVLGSVSYLVSGSLFGLYRRNKESLSGTLKALALTYAGIVVITFFVRNLAYTRLGLILGFVFGVIFFVTYKLIKINRYGKDHQRGKVKNARVIIVGDTEHIIDIRSKIHARPDWNYQIIGNVSVHEEALGSETLGNIAQLKDLVRAYHAEQVFFSLNSISYKRMLLEIAELQKEDLIFKLIPDSMDFILGKSNVEYMEAIPFVEVEFRYSNPLNQFVKRMLDLGISIPLFIILLCVTWPSIIFRKKALKNVDHIKLYAPITKHAWKNRLRLLGYVITGKLSLVGIPVNSSSTEQVAKKGITGIIQINRNRIHTEEEAESFSLYYLQNYSVWMDIDIILKTMFNSPHPLDLLQEEEDYNR